MEVWWWRAAAASRHLQQHLVQHILLLANLLELAAPRDDAVAHLPAQRVERLAHLYMGMWGVRYGVT